MHQIVPGATPGSWQYVIHARGRRLADADFDGARNCARLLFTDGTEQVLELPVREPVVAKVSRKRDTITLRWEDHDSPAVVAVATQDRAADIVPQASTPHRENDNALVHNSAPCTSIKHTNDVHTLLNSMCEDATESSRTKAAETATEVMSELESKGAISKPGAVAGAPGKYESLIEDVSQLHSCRKADAKYPIEQVAAPRVEPKAATSRTKAPVTGASDDHVSPVEDVPPLEDIPPPEPAGANNASVSATGAQLDGTSSSVDIPSLEDMMPLDDAPPLEPTGALSEGTIGITANGDSVPPLEDVPLIEDVPPLEPAGALTANAVSVSRLEDVSLLEDVPPLEPAGALTKSKAGKAVNDIRVPPLEDVPELISAWKVEKVSSSANQINVEVPDDCLNPAAEELFLKMEAQRLKQKEEAKKKQAAAAAKVNKSSFGLKKGFFSSANKSGDKTASASSTKLAKKDEVIEVAPKRPNENPLQLKEVQDTMKATAKDTSWVTPAILQAMESKPDLMKGMANPKIQEALELMRTNPEAGLAKYKADPEVMSFINEFSSLMANHTDAYKNILTSASKFHGASREPSSTRVEDGSGSTPTEAPLVDKELMEIMQDPEMQQLINILRTQPVEINAYLARRPHLMPKVKVLIDRKLFNLSTTT